MELTQPAQLNQPAQLSRLERVPLRHAWPNEAADFTPWLAQPQNLALLGDTIGLELECECQEKSVGPFSADILCRDTTTGDWVLIENQIERTDHTHLGQLLTYAAGIKAATIVWIADKFREEHRAALDWLNEITTEEFNFFALEVELWRIAGSPLAPKFNIVSKPNDWSRDLRETAREAADLTEGKLLQRDYWAAFMTHLQDHGRHNTPKPLAQNWMNFPVGRSGLKLCTVANTYKVGNGASGDGEIRAEFVMESTHSAQHYEWMETRRQQIEQALAPDAVHWYSREGVKMRKIFVRRDADIRDRNDWPAQHQWLRERLNRFEQVFRPLVGELGRD